MGKENRTSGMQLLQKPAVDDRLIRRGREPLVHSYVRNAPFLFRACIDAVIGKQIRSIPSPGRRYSHSGERAGDSHSCTNSS